MRSVGCVTTVLGVEVKWCPAKIVLNPDCEANVIPKVIDTLIVLSKGDVSIPESLLVSVNLPFSYPGYDCLNFFGGLRQNVVRLSGVQLVQATVSLGSKNNEIAKQKMFHQWKEIQRLLQVLLAAAIDADENVQGRIMQITML